MLFKQAQRQNQATGQFQADAWNEALKEAGIDQATYNSLHSQDPAGTEKLIKQSMKAVAKGVASRKGKAGPTQEVNTQLHTQRSVPQQNQKAKDFITTAQDEVNKGRVLTESEEESVMDALTEGLNWQ